MKYMQGVAVCIRMQTRVAVTAVKIIRDAKNTRGCSLQLSV